MSSENVDGIAAYAHARAGYQAGVDRVADCYVSAACAFGSHVALGGEAREKIAPRGVSCHQGSFWNALLNGLQVFRSRMKEEVNVGVDQSGHQRCVAEVDDLGSGGTSDGCSNCDDSVAFDKDFARADDFAVSDVEHSRCVEHDWMLRRGLSRATERSKDERQRTGKGLHRA
jgi:hypothetical protein